MTPTPRPRDGEEIDIHVEPRVPNGWSLIFEVNPDRETIKCYRNVQGQKFSSIEDVMKYVEYTKKRKSIYTPIYLPLKQDTDSNLEAVKLNKPKLLSPSRQNKIAYEASSGKIKRSSIPNIFDKNMANVEIMEEHDNVREISPPPSWRKINAEQAKISKQKHAASIIELNEPLEVDAHTMRQLKHRKEIMETEITPAHLANTKVEQEMNQISAFAKETKVFATHMANTKVQQRTDQTQNASFLGQKFMPAVHIEKEFAKSHSSSQLCPDWSLHVNDRAYYTRVAQTMIEGLVLPRDRIWSENCIDDEIIQLQYQAIAQMLIAKRESLGRIKSTIEKREQISSEIAALQLKNAEAQSKIAALTRELEKVKASNATLESQLNMDVPYQYNPFKEEAFKRMDDITNESVSEAIMIYKKSKQYIEDIFDLSELLKKAGWTKAFDFIKAKRMPSLEVSNMENYDFHYKEAIEKWFEKVRSAPVGIDFDNSTSGVAFNKAQ